MSANNLKEDLELIAALTASTAGFIKNNVNGMMVGDSKFIKADIQPREVIEKAKANLVKEHIGSVPNQPQFQPQPQPQPQFQQSLALVNPPSQYTTTQPIIPTTPAASVDPNQLTFNFDNSPTAQNIYYKLNTIIERLDKLNEKVNGLSEHIIKKKLDKKEKKV